MTALKEQWQQARELRQAELQQRRQQLTEQLAEIATHRQARAIATANARQTYITDLQAKVGQIRQHNQQDLASLQADVLAMAVDVQASLIELRQDRQAWGTDLMESLATDADALRQTVSQFLQETTEIRRDQAATLYAQRQADRQAQIQEVAAIRQSIQAFLTRIKAYRQQLKVYRQQLSESVWGSLDTPAGTSAPATSNDSLNGTVEAPTSPTHPQPTEQAKAEALAALKTPLSQTEQSIWDHLKTTDGLKVIDIEQALMLQRLNTIDALRVLQQRGLVLQKERRYYAAG